jgi:hypothetical protein
MSMSNTQAKGSGRVRHRCGLRACDGYGPACQWRALRTLMPDPAAATSCVLPSIKTFLRYTLTCASVTMELFPAPFHGSAVRTATTGKSNCRGSGQRPAQLALRGGYVSSQKFRSPRRRRFCHPRRIRRRFSFGARTGGRPPIDGTPWLLRHLSYRRAHVQH